MVTSRYFNGKENHTLPPNSPGLGTKTSLKHIFINFIEIFKCCALLSILAQRFFHRMEYSMLYETFLTKSYCTKHNVLQQDNVLADDDNDISLVIVP